ncbi:nuclear factor 7, brain-like [Hemicordylus capensis]|uniref:nuclear factor 7, brain-like n=1 Tax=Hemicordylus capensis TaxID=884348 RepID=UPI00230445E0|nr:nuclear factor 7, brain-like [Hemicordylus capensis]
MASSLAEELVCPICLAIFREPQMLACGHNYCLSCLESCVPKGKTTGTCPECRGPFKLRELACNRALANLAAKARKLKLEPETLQSAATAGFCEEHEEPLKLFCRQDQVPICIICRDLPHHRGHAFLPTKNAVQQAKGKLKPILKPLKRHLKESSEDELAQQEEIEELERCTENVLGHISSGFAVLHQILDKKEQGIKKTVQKMRKENLKEMESSLSLLKEEVSSCTETIAKVNSALESTDHIAFLKGLKELMEKIEDILPGEVEDEDNDEEEENESSEIWEDVEEEEEEEEEEGDEEEEEEEVISVDPALKTFKDLLDFAAWKKMLEGIKPKHMN